jgi:hypothetical protein
MFRTQISLLIFLALAGCSAVGSIGRPPPDGYLEGTVSVGPLTPVERVGVPTPTPAPEVFTSRGLQIYASDGKTPVASLRFNPDGTYRIALPPGKYVVALLGAGMGPEFSRDLPREVEITRGKTTRLDISIDTGIR